MSIKWTRCNLFFFDTLGIIVVFSIDTKPFNKIGILVIVLGILGLYEKVKSIFLEEEAQNILYGGGELSLVEEGGLIELPDDEYDE